MYVGKPFSPSDPGESEVYSFDFRKDLPDGASIASVVWTCEVVTGTDADADDRLVGAPSNAGTVSSHVVADLQPGVKYRLRAVVTTDQGDDVSLWSHVTCKTPT